jgi:uncharacterized 2Fe-2S/4Fe-4S cluster protein (DUF4445 family)
VTDASFDIVFEPDQRRYRATGPVPLYLAAAAAGILVEQPCGSQGICGDCRVRVVEGAPPPTAADVDLVSASDLASGWRLGCKLVLEGPATVEVPTVVRSLAGKSFGDVLRASSLERPVVRSARVALGGEPPRPVLDVVSAALGSPPDRLPAPPAALAELSDAAADATEIFAVADDAGLLTVRRREPVLFGLALDLGTTSLAAGLVRLQDGGVAASAARLNPQVAVAADVIGRIHHAMHREGGLRRLTAAVREGVRALVDDLLAASGIEARDVVIAAVAGNPTMLHAWAGVGIGTLGVAPYQGVWSRELSCRAREVGLDIHPTASVWVFPQVGSHVGGDAVGAAIACDLDRGAGRRLLVDLGTNSEVIVSSGGRIVATSAAAGPAFEGVSIRQGMRAAPGAVDVVSFARDGRVTVHAIGDVLAAGICGSGLIDLVAELLRAGVVSASGYLRKPGDLVTETARPFADRLVTIDGQQAFEVVPADEVTGDGLAVTARDIREVQLAKGSILTACTLACRCLGFEPGELDEVLVAGAFGNYIRKASAIRIGLVPPIDPERVRLVGNAAGVAARLALVDRGVRERARTLASRAELVELATRSDYQDTFMASLAFPAGSFHDQP